MPGLRWNFSLKQLLLASGLVSVAVGMVAAASLRGVGVLAVPGAALLGLGIGILARRPRLVCGFFVLMAVASWLTSGIRWIGGTRPYQWDLTVVDTQGNPIEGAMVIPRLGRKPITDRFFMDRPQVPPVTDEFGELSCLVKGHNFGGERWSLFWYIPIPNHAPHYIYRSVVDVEHPRYETVRYSATRLLDAVDALEEPEINFDTDQYGYWDGIRVYPLTVTMRAK